MSVIISPETITYVWKFVAQSDGDEVGIKIKMTCYKADYIGILKKNNEIEKIRWLYYDDLEWISEVDKIIFNYLKRKFILNIQV